MDSAGDDRSMPPKRRSLVPRAFRKRWVVASTLLVIGVNAAVLVWFPGLGSAALQSCGGGGSGSGGSGGGGCADLSVKLAQSDSTVQVGHRLFYLIQLTNHGPSFADDVLVEDVLPSSVGTQWAMASSFGSCVTPPPRLHVVTCEFYELQPGETEAMTLVVVPRKAGKIVNKAGAASRFTPDPNKHNNTDSISTTITP